MHNVVKVATYLEDSASLLTLNAPYLMKEHRSASAAIKATLFLTVSAKSQKLIARTKSKIATPTTNRVSASNATTDTT